MKTPTVFELLAASGPLTELADRLMLFGQFVGTWDVDAVWYKKGGERKKGKGEWTFGWILGGRGVQDVLFVTNAEPHQYGTTLRCYDSLLDAWHVAWMQPAIGEFVNLLGRRIGDRIVLEGLGNDYLRRLRWSFSEITPNSFLWTGEVSTDHGATWFLEVEMHAVRRTEGAR